MTSKKHQRVLKVREDKENYFLEEYQIKFIGGKIILNNGFETPDFSPAFESNNRLG